MIRYPLDLHLHSRFSDGLETPESLCAKAARLRLKAVALCDHDTTDGLAPMAEAVAALNTAQPEPMAFIPSIELSAGLNGRTHILGYGVDPRHAGLIACLTGAKRDRQARAEAILDRLEAEDIRLPADVRASLNSPTVGRAHIARALMAQGVVNTVQQAFDRYLAEGRSAYVPRKLLPAADAAALLKAAGAIPVLAHPCRLALDEPALLALISELAEAGLMGVEAYHPSASPSSARQLEGFARRMGLLVTGGSDYHGDPNTRVALAHMPSGWQSWQDDLLALQAHIR